MRLHQHIYLIKKELEIYRRKKVSKYRNASSQDCINIIYIPAGISSRLTLKRKKQKQIRILNSKRIHKAILLGLVTNTFKCAPRNTCHCSHFNIKFSFYTIHESYQCFCYNCWKLILHNVVIGRVREVGTKGATV